MIDFIAVFVLGVIVGAGVTGGYVYWKIKKIKENFIGDLSLLDQP